MVIHIVHQFGGCYVREAEMTYVAYFATCLEELADSSKTPKEWAKEHIKTDKMQLDKDKLRMKEKERYQLSQHT